MNELVVTGQKHDLDAMDRGTIICTLDPKTVANRLLMARAVQTQVPSIMEAVNLELVVSDILLHPIQIVNKETGEVKDLIRCVLFCHDGKQWSFCGRKPLKDVLLPAKLFGLELPYRPAQRFVVKREKVKEGDGFYASLEWVGEAKK